MNLSGQFEDFGLSKFLQFLSMDNASGVLELRHKDDQIVIQFQKGEICDIDHKRDPKINRMKAVLIDGERIDGRDFSMLLQELEQGKKSVGSLLQKYGAVSAEEMGELNRLVCNDILVDALQWNSCEYSFKARKPGSNGYSEEFSMPIQQVLLEAFRQEDSWGFVREIVPTVDVVFRPIVNTKTRDTWKATYAKCDEKDRRVIRLITGKNTVQKIAHKSLRSIFDVSRILWQLERSGLIVKDRKAVVPGQDRFPPGYFDMQSNRKVGVIIAVGGGILLFLAFMLMQLYFK